MGRYRVVLELSVDDEALRQYNERDGLQLDPDPTEWNEDNLALAIGEEVAIIDTLVDLIA